MSKENVQRFYDLVKEKKEMENGLEGALTTGNIVGFAKEKGFEFTEEEHDEFIAGVTENEGELSDDEIGEAANGFHIPGIPQIKVICMQCGWNSGWKDINGFYSYGTLTALHYATTQHTKFGAKHRK